MSGWAAWLGFHVALAVGVAYVVYRLVLWAALAGVPAY